MYDNGGFRFMILPSAPLSGFQDNGTVSRDSNKRVVVGFKFNRLRLSAQKVNERYSKALAGIRTPIWASTSEKLATMKSVSRLHLRMKA